MSVMKFFRQSLLEMLVDWNVSNSSWFANMCAKYFNFFQAHSDSGTEYKQIRSVYFVEFDLADRSFRKYTNIIIIVLY
jgi:hypothetical protein